MRKVLLLNITLFISIFAFAQSKSVQRTVVLEQFTTENCGSCPYTLSAIEAHMDVNPNFVIITHHSGYGTDRLTIEESLAHREFYNAGGSTFTPAGMFDRHYNGLDNDNYQGTDPGPVFWDAPPQGTNRIDERTNIPAFVTVNIYGDHTSTSYNITVTGEFLDNFSQDIGVSLWITEDNITSETQSGASGTWTHRFTVRDAISSRLGDIITESINTGDTFSKEYSFDVLDEWNLDELYLVAIIGNNDDSDVNNREIHNAKQIRLTDLQAVPVSVSEFYNRINIYPNPSDNKIIIDNAKNANIKIYDLTGKLVFSKNNINEYQSIDLSNLNKGTYFIKVNRNNTIETRKIIIST